MGIVAALTPLWRGRPSEGWHPTLPSGETPQQLDQHPLVLRPTCLHTVMPMCPASELFADPEIHEVVTDNVLRAGSTLLGLTDRDMVMSTVATVFTSIGTQFRRHAPKIASDLDKLQFTNSQRDLIRNSVRLAGDPRVQGLGFDVSSALRSNVSADPKQRIEQFLRPHLQDIRNLRDTLVPAELREPESESYKWTMTLETRKMIVAENMSEMWSPSNIDANDLTIVQKNLTQQEKSMGVEDGVLEEGLALVDLIELGARLFGQLNLPAFTSLVSIVDIRLEPLSCSRESVKDSGSYFRKAIFCQLKLGVQGVDALRAVFDMERSTNRVSWAS